MNLSALEIRIVNNVLEQSLGEFFRELENTGDNQQFHPHPFTVEEAKKRVRYSGQDLYYALVAGTQVLGYGMLRGWDEGYKIPSLGIAVHPDFRGMGFGKLLMYYLHTAARYRGAKKIRLKVYSENRAAVALYEKLGYQFESEEAGQKVGYLNL